MDARGGVSLLEIHPQCALKPCGVGRKEMSACWDPVITNRATRRGAWGATLLGMARYVEAAHFASKNASPKAFTKALIKAMSEQLDKLLYDGTDDDQHSGVI